MTDCQRSKTISRNVCISQNITHLPIEQGERCQIRQEFGGTWADLPGIIDDRVRMSTKATAGGMDKISFTS